MGFNRVKHGAAARRDMHVFILECWFKYSNESSLKYDIEIWDFDIAKDSPSSNESTPRSPFDSSFAGTLEAQKNP